MPRNANARPRRGARSSARLQDVVSQLRELNVTNDQQITRPPPVQQDIPRMHIRRDKVYTVFEAYLGPAINYVLGTGNGGSFTFSLSLLSNATSYASIFDQYRIAYAEVDFVPATSVNTINVGGAYPPLYTAIDYDGNVSNTVADLVQYQTAQYAPLGAFLQRRLNPRCLLTVSAGSVADALASPRQWVDMANTAVPYFGVSWAVGPGPASNIGWTTTIRLCVQFKNPR